MRPGRLVSRPYVAPLTGSRIAYSDVVAQM
jgi:hypothetical protein